MKRSISLSARFIFIGAFVAVFCPSASAGYPTLFANPITGFARLHNDPAPYTSTDTIILYSYQNRLLMPPERLIPGATYSFSSWPYAMHLFNVPTGTFDLGLLYQPHTPISGMGVVYFPRVITPPPRGGAVVEIPEPSTLAHAALCGLLAFRRRK